METNLKLSPAALAKTEHELIVSLIPEVFDFLDKHKWKDESEIISEAIFYIPAECDEAAEFYFKKIKSQLNQKDNNNKKTFFLSQENIQEFRNTQLFYEGNGYIMSSSLLMNLALLNYFDNCKE